MNKSLREEIRAVLALGVAAVAFAPVAMAQEQAPKEEEEALAEVEFQEVVVTGSRIRRSEFTSPAPVTVITNERSQLAGLLTTEDILRESTVASGEQVNDTFSGFITDGGPGANVISLRGLGAQRTLVLVNGKRWAPSGVQGQTNSVDLSAIPSSIIGRIEILKDGASSIYGADAVAGVINVITKESFDGLQLNAQGQATHDGGGERYVLDATWGTVGDRGSFSISLQYAEQKELVRADRDWAACNTYQRWTDQNGRGNLDFTDPFTGEPLCFGDFDTFNATAIGTLRYEPSLTDPFDTTNPYHDPRIAAFLGVPYFTRVPVNGFLPGEPPLGTGSFVPEPLYQNDGGYYTDTQSSKITQILYPTKLYSATSFGQLDFDVGAGTSTAYYEAYFNRRETAANGGYWQFAPQLDWLTYDETALHPYNPFAELAFFGNPAFGQPFAVLPNYGMKDPNTYVDIDRYNVFAGLRGDLAGDWDYDAVLGYGHSKGTYRFEEFLEAQVEAAVNGIVIRPDGSVTCADEVLAQYPGCVPANLFTEDAQLRGILPADVLDFITKNTKGSTVYEGLSLSAYATGPLFSVPAGSVKAVFGVEYRDESINDVPDPEAQANNLFNRSTAGITKGDDQVREVFTEIEVPLASGKRFAEDLYISGSLRWTDYESYGDDTTYRLAFNYQVTPQFLVRSTYGTSFRAPDLYEQFLGDTVGFQSALSDPCYNYGQNNNPGDTLYDNCASFGLPEDFFPTQSITSIYGGTDDLKAETSDSLTIGLVFTPSFADFSFAVDYFDITVENTVARPGTSFLLGQCYDSVDFTSPYCERVGDRTPYTPNPDGTQGPGGLLTYVDRSFLNIGEQRSRGYDFNFLYDHQFPSGRLVVDATATYLMKQTEEIFGIFSRLEGRWGFPRLTATGQVRYDWKDWRLGWTMDFIGESEEQPIYDPGTTNQDRQNRTPNMLYHTLSLRYSQSNWDAIATVRNVFDKDPPYVGNGHANQGATRFLNTLPGVGYDLFGRSYVLQLSYSF